MDIKNAVKGQVFFEYYKDQSLWYSTEQGDLFPVPISDTGNAVFKKQDKGILFMRYMKKWKAEIEKEPGK